MEEENVLKNKYKHKLTGKIAVESSKESCVYLIEDRKIPKFIVDGNDDWESITV